MNYNAGIYIRLSQEDKNKKYESDSESVVNQKQLLRNYCKKNNFNIYDEYVDDGYSGTNFDRPGFTKMIGDIKDKKINLVIVKDLSRLGRDHVLTGYYIEKYFPENRVRFISVVENYDSKPCYGYMRDPEDKGHLIPDFEVAKYVKLIFEWRAKEIGISEIATRLTKIGAPTPASYKRLSSSSIVEKKKKWTIHTVNNILHNRMYTGDMVQHKETNISYKSKKRITLDESMWIVVEGTHEPLVDKNTFMIINKKTRNKNRCYSKRKRPERLLEGLLFCHECGNRLGVLYRRKQNYWCINCNKYARDPVRKLCTSHFFAYDYFEKLV